jgi:hypothetical protein
VPDAATAFTVVGVGVPGSDSPGGGVDGNGTVAGVVPLMEFPVEGSAK